ncbi:MAG: LamG-like jellyroll fold domain-containing protein [bacterium]
MSIDTNLIGYWKLTEDCRDYSGKDNHGVRRKADPSRIFVLPRAERAYHIEVPHNPSLSLGTGGFSISVWIKTPKKLDDVLGDIVNKYDPASRTGFNLYLQNFAGAPSAHANYRNLFFGMDDGRIESHWTDCGRPGNNLMVWALTVYKGSLYAGTFETELGEAGHVYRYGMNGEWIDCGAPDTCNAVTSLAVFEGDLYAAVSHYRSSGSALEESPNTTRGGRIYRYGGDKNWIDCGGLPDPEAIGSLLVFQGDLYASSMYAPPGVYRYAGGTRWVPCGHPGGRIAAMTVSRGAIYGSGWDQGKSGVYRYEGETSWSDRGTPPHTTQTYSFAVHEGNLHVGTWPSGTVYRYAGDQHWSGCGRLGDELEVMGMAVYNGKLYAGTLPLAQVYRYDGNLIWTPTGQLDRTPDVKYRRAWSMAVYQGKLFCGTLPSGHVHCLEAGKGVSYDDEIQAGWRHIAAVRDKAVLNLFVDGKLISQSTVFRPDSYDLSNEQPLRIGFGPHDYFNGEIEDLRLYDRAITHEEVDTLYRRGR